ncbi:MAG TPA: GNAT family N-acetyltransferase [Acidimicrobiia bacterium]|jgi:GNAT superfamily N-acetyltransferase
MSFVIRPARPEDVPSIAVWTRDTFPWGDYVPEQLAEWLADDRSLVIVCTYEDDVPVAVARAQLLTPTEGWLSGARVHPEHRRAGMGSAMNDYSADWCRQHGARVARLVVEEGNQPARGQVERIGYRPVSHWLYAIAEVTPGRSPTPGRLRPAGSLDADAAWMLWSQSDLAKAGRELLAERWRWRRATRDDLERAVADRSLYQGEAGYAVVDEIESGIALRWLVTTDADAPIMLQELFGLARERGAISIEAMVPDTPWLAEAMRREGFEARPMVIYAKAL